MDDAVEAGLLLFFFFFLVLALLLPSAVASSSRSPASRVKLYRATGRAQVGTWVSC